MGRGQRATKNWLLIVLLYPAAGPEQHPFAVGTLRTEEGAAVDDDVERSLALLQREPDDQAVEAGKRTPVDSSDDRYANLETNYLLARLEQFRGVAVVLFDSLQEAQRRRGRLQPVVLRFPPA